MLIKNFKLPKKCILVWIIHVELSILQIPYSSLTLFKYWAYFCPTFSQKVICNMQCYFMICCSKWMKTQRRLTDSSLPKLCLKWRCGWFFILRHLQHQLGHIRAHLSWESQPAYSFKCTKWGMGGGVEKLLKVLRVIVSHVWALFLLY